MSRLENYEDKLLSLHSNELSPPKSHLSYGDLTALVAIETAERYDHELRKLADRLPYQPSSWPSFGQYSEDWYRVEVSPFKKQLLYCERGSCQIRADCDNLIDLSYQIFNIVSPGLTPSAAKIAESLDRINDQRLLIWLRMSSKIYYMYQTNMYFGICMLTTNVTWMCEELVRMEVFPHTTEAFESERHIVHGLRLSGLPRRSALNMYRALQTG